MLKILNLASNRICDVTALELKTCSNLVFLDLSSNNLKSFKVLLSPFLQHQNFMLYLIYFELIDFSKPHGLIYCGQ